MDLPLWPGENPLADLWSEIRPKILSAENWQAGDWQFWVTWYEQMLDPETNPPNWPLLDRIALMDPEVWDAGPEAVSEKIAEIERDFEVSTRPKPVGDVGEASLISGGRAGLRRAMIANRRDLPPTFDAIIGYITLEVERLQQRNHTSDAEAEEARRQIAVLTTLSEAVSQLQGLVPSTSEMPDEDVEEAEHLVSFVFRRMKEWPRAKPGDCPDNVADLVDNSYRAALIGVCTYCAPLLSVPPTHALIAGTAIFGGKKLLDSAKSAKGLIGDGKS